jgi:hypothetical protein
MERRNHVVACNGNWLVKQTERTAILKTRTHQAWQHMKQRCADANHKDFHSYGGRGIRVCERWLRFENFLADMGEKSAGMTLDRKDNDGNYEPDNCRWASPKQQGNNTRRNLLITRKGVARTLTEWAEESGMRPQKVWERIYKLGWDIERALLP